MHILFAPDSAAGTPPAIDPFVKELADSFDSVVTPDGKMEAKPPVPEEDLHKPSPMTLGELAAEKKAAEPALDKDGKPVAPAAAPAVKPAEPALATAPVTKLKKKVAPVATPPPAAPVAAVPAAQPAPAAPTPQPAAPAPAAAPVEDPYLNTLSDDQRDELDFAKFAETKMGDRYKGLSDKMLAYYKKVDDYAKLHPGVNPSEDQDFAAFLQQNRPKYEGSDRRKLEKLMIEDLADERAQRAVKTQSAEMQTKMDRELAEVKRRQYIQEVTPKVAEAAKTFESGVVEGTFALPDGVQSISKDVAEAIKTKGYAEAVKEFPVEAPILQSTIAAGQEYLGIVNQLRPYDERNPVHNWLVNFVEAQGKHISAAPDAVRVRDGKSFLPISEYNALAASKPAELVKHWTFSDADVLGMIAVNGHIAAHSEVAKLERAGFTRVKKTAVSPSATPAVVPKPQETSPRAGGSRSPGAATTTPAAGSNSAFLESLVPGAGQFATN